MFISVARSTEGAFRAKVLGAWATLRPLRLASNCKLHKSQALTPYYFGTELGQHHGCFYHVQLISIISILIEH
jgi:hypothetical protein